MTHTILIYDLEQRYAIKLAEYINTRNDFYFEARFCIDDADLLDAFNRWNIDLVLSCELAYDDVIKFIDKSRVIVLSGDTFYQKQEVISIFKYQSCDNIIREILKKASKMDDIGQLIHRKSVMKLYGVFGPYEGMGNRWLAYELAKELSKNGKSILICLNAFSKIQGIIDYKFESDLSEIIYELCVLNRQPMAVIGGNVYVESDLSILPDVRNYRDLISITYEEWRQFLDKIEVSTDYENVILDIGEGIQNLPGLLASCNSIYIGSNGGSERNYFDKLVEILSFEGVKNADQRIKYFETKE